MPGWTNKLLICLLWIFTELSRCYRQIYSIETSPPGEPVMHGLGVELGCFRLNNLHCAAYMTLWPYRSARQSLKKIAD